MGKVLQKGQTHISTLLLIAAALTLSIGWGLGIASDDWIAKLVRCWLLAVFGTISVILLLTRPFLALCLQITVLSTAPLLRLYLPIRDVPIYAADVLLMLSLLGTMARDQGITLRHLPRPVRWGLVVFGMASFISSINLAITTNLFLEPFYPLARHLLLTIGTFYVASRLLRSYARKRLIVRILFVGVILNALLAVIQNLPGAQVIGAQIALWVYGEESFPYFKSGRFGEILAGNYRRGFGLFQSATTLSGVLSMALALCAFSGRDIIRQNGLRNLLIGVLVAGVLATYSRQAILGLLTSSILSVLVLRRIRFSIRTIITLVIPGVLVIAFNLVDFSFLYLRSKELMDLQETSMARRITGYFNFVDYLVENPFRVLIGNGTGIGDLSDRGLIPFSADQQLLSGFVSNSYLLMAYNFGILGFVSYLFLFGTIIMQSALRLRRKVIAYSSNLLLGLTSALIVAAVLHLFDNYFAESYHTRGIFWLLMALTVSTSFITDEARCTERKIGQIRRYIYNKQPR